MTFADMFGYLADEAYETSYKSGFVEHTNDANIPSHTSIIVG